MSHTVVLALGYGLTWAAIVAYLLRMRRREQALDRPLGHTPSPPGHALGRTRGTPEGAGE